ncbi:hypothetical protein OIU84_019876 [Salix udensis]|uniref:Uncharacterized protein n=1 Tax=Salix udensis TaxID=889485 RepID=A0AAD6PJY9_9ROSI|nr:hypothetical protein OIU84_019876 [Salix udensis]
MTGCIANLYGSLENLDQSYLQPNQNKDSILKPTITTQITNPSFLLPNTKTPIKPKTPKLYYCPRHPGLVSDIQNSVCSQCRSQGYGTVYLSQEVKFAVTNDSTSTDTATSDQGGYVKGVEKVVEFGIDEGIKLLKASLSSKDALTAVFLLKDKDGAPS